MGTLFDQAWVTQSVSQLDSMLAIRIGDERILIPVIESLHGQCLSTLHSLLQSWSNKCK